MALVSPIDHLGEERLFTMHMVQHLLLADLAPILLLLGSRARCCARRCGACGRSRSGSARWRTRRGAGALGRTMWLWHVPALYDLAARAPLGAPARARQLLHGRDRVLVVPDRARAAPPPACAALVARLPQRGQAADGRARRRARVRARRCLRRLRATRRGPGASRRLEDLNVGGVVMMVEQSLVLVVVFAILFARMLERSERDQQRRERFEGRPEPRGAGRRAAQLLGQRALAGDGADQHGAGSTSVAATRSCRAAPRSPDRRAVADHDRAR